MKKQFKKVMLSALVTAALATASTATIFAATAKADENVTQADATKFEMVDGAAIRLTKPYGLRFIAELGAETYNDLMTKEAGVTKQMGMFIVPYEYLSDPTKYVNGEADVAAGNYQNFKQFINHVFYDSTADNTSDPDGSIYQVKGQDVWRANGVIANLKLKNFDREFVGIAYIAETVGGVTTYTYADFDEENDVRSAVYVAIEAYDDYKDDDVATAVFNDYAHGAHLNSMFPGEIVEITNGSGADKTVSYTYGGETYDTIDDLVAEWSDPTFSVFFDKASNMLFIGGKLYVGYTLYNGDSNGEEISFNNAHAVWHSSNEAVATVDENGVVTAVGAGQATITASFMGTTATCKTVVLDGTFETVSTAPNYISKSRVQSLDIVEMNGSKVLQATTTADSTSDVGLEITTEALGAIFADPDVAYMAFDLKSGATRTGNKVYYHGNGASSWTQYENGSYDTIPTDAFKTYYFPRSEYENWVNAGKTSARFVMIGGGLVYGGEKFYIDNLRGVTEAEKTADWYSFEYGGLRTNNGNSPLFYEPSSGSWSISFSNINSATAGFTSEIVSDGTRALKFTKLAGDTAFSFNHTTDTAKETAMRSAGYVSLDLYVPAGSDAKVVKNGFYSALKEGWNTVYAKVDATANEWFRFTDTTASTYVVDNIQFITEEEYYENAYSFESGAGVLRTAEIGDSSTNGGVFYYYGGADMMTSTYSFAFLEGNGSGDVNAISNPRYDGTITHSGAYSLAFEKGNGYMSVQMRNDSTAFAKLSGGFSFWIYSTTAVNGTTANNFINGANGKFNGGTGITIPANTWTKVAGQVPFISTIFNRLTQVR